jgi:phage tail protein X
MNYLNYLTQDGDRWDILAWIHYGDPFAYEEILRANPLVSPAAELAGGTVIRIPILEAVVAPTGWTLWL